MIPTIDKNKKGSRSVFRGFTGKQRGIQHRLPNLNMAVADFKTPSRLKELKEPAA